VNLCPLLQKLFGAELKCSSTTESFTRPSQVSETFSSSASYQYFQILPSLSHFNQYLQANAWHTDLKARIACENEAEFATYAASLDVDYDAISHAVGLSAAWSADADALVKRPGSGITDRVVVQFRENHRVEVGVLQSEKADEVEELSLGGYLAVLGEHDKPSMFSFLHKRCDLKLTSISRPNAVLFPLSPPSSPSRPVAALRHSSFPASYRPSPKARPQFSCQRPHSASTLLCSARLPNPSLSPLHRPLPVLRRPLPAVPEPQSPPCPQRLARPRSSRLGDRRLGLSSAL
jgi:hypothetical protein